MILGLLPMLCWCFVGLIFKKRGLCWRSSFLAASVIWGVLLTGMTEMLSLCNLLNFRWLLLCWAVATLTSMAIYHFVSQKEFSEEKLSIPIFLKVLVGSVTVISILTGLIASIAPPNTFDSMTYHMARVMHWIQNESVAHYPTHILRQLHSNPWAEFAITHLQILSGQDYLANLVQWFSMVGCILGGTLIAKKFGAEIRGQIFTAVVIATLPMGILQASSTQNDYVVSFWLICFVYYSILLREEPSWYFSFAVGTSLGLAILTKGTAYIYAAPFVLWLAVSMLKKVGLRCWKPALVIGLIALSINFGHYTRNFLLYGAPLGPGRMVSVGGWSYTNDVFSASAIFSNALRNCSLHLGTPSVKVNDSIEKGINYSHRLLGLDVNDPQTTWKGTEFHIHKLSRHEDRAGNPAHFVLIAICIALLVFSKKAREPMIIKYFLAVTFGFLLFCTVLRWQPWHNRLNLPVFVLWAPVFGLTISRFGRKRFSSLIMILLVILSLPWLLGNKTRPLIGNNSILYASRFSQYFANRSWVKESYLETIHLIKSKQLKKIGLHFRPNDWEYPIWVLLRSIGDKMPDIEHVDVQNISRKISLRKFRPDAFLEIIENRELSIVSKRSHEWKTNGGNNEHR